MRPKQDARIYFELFLYLQVLDFLTTLVGFKVGLVELSPFVRHLTQINPTLGVAISKSIAVGLGALCIWIHRTRIIRWINYWFAALVAWNLCLILSRVMAPLS